MTADPGILEKAFGGHRPPLQLANFDYVAPFYGILERIAFGQALQRARIAFLDRAIASSRVLIVGEGNGRFLAELLRTDNSEIEIDCVDSSAEMLRRSRERVQALVIPSGVEGSRRETLKSISTGSLDYARNEQLRFHHGDILAWQPQHEDYDLIVTHFFLDCFDPEQLPRVIDKISSLAASNARWLISDFSLPPRGFPRLHARIWLHSMYSFFRLLANLQTLELVPFAPLLREHRFELPARCDSCLGLISAQFWQR